DAMCDALLRQLDDESEQKRAAAVRLLSTIAVRDDEPRARSVLLSLTDPSPVVTRAWLDAVAVMGDQSALERVLRCFESDTPVAVRRSAQQAAQALGARHPDRARELAQDITPGEPRAEGVCWFMTVRSEPLWSREADLAFLTNVASSPSASARLS